MANIFEYYRILGISPDADRRTLDEAYYALKEKYCEDRFLDGEAGNEGAVNLMNLENAYAEIDKIRRQQEAEEKFGTSLGAIDAKIIAGDLDGAQRDLDATVERTAEWHYLQAVLYYKRNWLSESRNHVKIAVSMDPNNQKYTSALFNLERVMNPPDPGQAHYYNNVPPYGADGGMPPRDNSMGIGNCCTALCLMDCCCNLMRCC